MSNQFKVGLSFPGTLRDSLIKEVASILAIYFRGQAQTKGEDLILYDDFHRDNFNQARLDSLLPGLYRNKCDVIAVFLCADYSEHHWCGLEWAEISKLRQDPYGCRKLYFLWCGDRNDDILRMLGLDRKHDGIIDICNPAASEIARGILNRLDELNKGSQSIFTPIADALYESFVPTQSPLQTTRNIHRLAVVLSSHGIDTEQSYFESDKYEVSIYVKHPFHHAYHSCDDSDLSIEYLDLRRIRQDWSIVADALVQRASSSLQTETAPIVEIFIPYELLTSFLALDLLNVPCHLYPQDDFFDKVSLSCLCALVIRPLDRYSHPGLSKDLDLLRRKYARLANGTGRWIHGDDAASANTLLARRDFPEDVAVRMIDILPDESRGIWLKMMIGSMVPVALWWAGSTDLDREGHLREYKCNGRSFLDVGPESQVMMTLDDLDTLLLERKRLIGRASSLVLMVDNPNLVPELPYIQSQPSSAAYSTPIQSVS